MEKGSGAPRYHGKGSSAEDYGHPDDRDLVAWAKSQGLSPRRWSAIGFLPAENHWKQINVNSSMRNTGV